ncbi:diacylglycerol/lipid kinase family protein [Corynebacterium ciconiae]|uniref:diacylglycerol/lipid kinase family protein n=1 Tax=Corynebacterium ciconiae TaxID=227319 RepID=UPI00058F2F68|nr:diacylglycerol kinase family protein [Corynebacterium ciconiae]
MRSLLLMNPNSTSVSHAIVREVVSALAPVTSIKAVHTAYPQHAEEICAGLRREDYDAIIVLGGDGTVGEVINGLLGKDIDARPDADVLPRLVIIPTGSANVYARALGLPNDPAEAAAEIAELLRAEAVRRLPLAMAHNVGSADSDAQDDQSRRWLCVNLGIGIDAAVIHSMEQARKRGMSATPGKYALIAARAWRRLRAHPPHISFTAETASGVREEKNLPLVVVSNTNPWTFAGPVPVVTNPDARTEGGLSIFALTSGEGPGGLAALMKTVGSNVRFWSALPVDTGEIQVDDINALTLTLTEKTKWQLDGEFMGETDRIDIVSVPEVIDVIAPEGPQLM